MNTKTWNKWTPEAVEELIEYRKMGMKYREIADIMEITMDAVKKKCSAMVKAGLLEPRMGGASTSRDYIDADLLSLVIKYQTLDNYNAHLYTDNLPPVSQIKSKYGNWTMARKAAGLETSICSLDPNKITCVYEVHFLEEDFYKIGITQRTVKQRFSGYPEYEIISAEYMTLEEAKALEKLRLLDKTPYKPQHPKFYRENKGGAGGVGECFKK